MLEKEFPLGPIELEGKSHTGKLIISETQSGYQQEIVFSNLSSKDDKFYESLLDPQMRANAILLLRDLIAKHEGIDLDSFFK